MSLLFGCWKENAFNNKVCEKFIQNLNNCHKKYLETSVIQKNYEQLMFLLLIVKHLQERRVERVVVTVNPDQRPIGVLVHLMENIFGYRPQLPVTSVTSTTVRNMGPG